MTLRVIGLVLISLWASLFSPTPARAAPGALRQIAQRVEKSVANAAYWGGLALRPLPGAIGRGLVKRWNGATHLDELLHADLSRMSPEELAAKARTLLYANPRQRIFQRAQLRTALHRVLEAYSNDPEQSAKTDVLLSRMILTSQNAGREARRLGRFGVREIKAKLQANRIDSTLPAGDRIAELKRRIALDNGAQKPGTMTFLKTGRSIQNAMIAQIRQARDAAVRGERAYYVFSSYVLEDDSPQHEVGARFAQALREAADAGVEIVGLYDRLGSIRSGVDKRQTRRGFYQEMLDHESPDGQRRIHLVPIAASPLMAHGSHQKWSVAVSQPANGEGTASAMIQDANIGSLYQGPHAPWQDTAARLEGPVVEDVAAMAIERIHANGYALSEPMVRALSAKRSLPVGGRPVDLTVLNHVAGQDLKNKRLVLNAIASTNKGDVIEWSQPYGEDEDVTNELVLAARARQVEIHLVYDRHNNAPTVAAAERSSYTRLLAAGVRIHEYGRTEDQHDVSPSTKLFSHSKVMIVKYATGVRMMAIGSANGDNRSLGDEPAAGILTGNDESVAVTFDSKKVNQIDRDFMRPQLGEHSVEIGSDDARQGASGRIAGWLLDRLRGFN